MRILSIVLVTLLLVALPVSAGNNVKVRKIYSDDDWLFVSFKGKANQTAYVTAAYLEDGSVYKARVRLNSDGVGKKRFHVGQDELPIRVSVKTTNGKDSRIRLKTIR